MQDITDRIVVETLPKVLVLMATYNGERYLRQQIESILNQNGVDVTLLITDDCSNDASYEISLAFAESDKRVISKRNQENVGVGMNFLNMLYDVEPGRYDYVAFSDQDDIWLEDKLLIACKVIADEIDKPDVKHLDPFGVPVLYCSDLQNVDEDLQNPVMELKELGRNHCKKTNPLIRNYYSGCTMVMNNSMVVFFQSKRLDHIYRIHDVWLALVARYCGNLIVDLNNARILRRLTGNNAVGALVVGGDFAKASFCHLKNKSENNITRTAEQFYERFGKYISGEYIGMVRSFAKCRQSPIRRFMWALRPDFCGTTFAESIYQKAKLVLGRY